MERESVVQDVSVMRGGQRYSASYFVEGRTIHASIGGRVLRCPVGNLAASSTVKLLLEGHLQHLARKQAVAGMWSRHLDRDASS